MQTFIRAVAATIALALAACATTPEPARRIEEAGYRPIGGIEQWVTLRGDDDRKPLLLLIHGGPGDVQSIFTAAYAPYERDFILVQWDQRGGGRTYEKLGAQTPELTLARQVDDGIELAEHLRKRFAGRKLVLLGHSWGTIVSTGMVQKRPELFDAYVGAGQVASWAAVFNHQHAFMLAAARAQGDADTVARLEALKPLDPTSFPQYQQISRTMRPNMPAADKAWFAALPTQPGVTPDQRRIAGEGMNFSGLKVIETLMRVDLTRTAPSFPIPWCVIHGREDLNTPLAPVEAYAAAIRAPAKELMVIDGAGHFALATHASEFIALMKQCPGL